MLLCTSAESDCLVNVWQTPRKPPLVFCCRDCYQAMQADFPSCQPGIQSEGTNRPPWFDDTALEQLQPPTVNAAEELPLWEVWQEQQRAWQERAATEPDVTVRHGHPQGRDLSTSPGLHTLLWPDASGADSLNTFASYPTASHGQSLLTTPAPDGRPDSPLNCCLQQAQEGMAGHAVETTARPPPLPLLPPSLQRRLQAHLKQQYALSFGHLPHRQRIQEKDPRDSEAAATAAASNWFSPGPYFPQPY